MRCDKPTRPPIAPKKYEVSSRPCGASPTRQELLTGRYFHNIKAAKPTDPGCMHVNVSLNTSLSPFYAAPADGGWYFAPHLQQAGCE